MDNQLPWPDVTRFMIYSELITIKYEQILKLGRQL